MNYFIGGDGKINKLLNNLSKGETITLDSIKTDHNILTLPDYMIPKYLNKKGNNVNLISISNFYKLIIGDPFSINAEKIEIFHIDEYYKKKLLDRLENFKDVIPYRLN